MNRFLALILACMFGLSGPVVVSAQRPIPLSGNATENLPPPAPGFVGIKDGHLVRDGRRLRIWGVNCVNEYRRPKEDQLTILDRIVGMGFNGIRIHLPDWRLVPPGAKGYEVATYIKGDGSAIDLFDHFIAAAAQRGLLIYMTFDRKETKILPEAWDILPPDEHEAEWKQAVVQLCDRVQPTTNLEQVWPLDARLEAVVHAWVRNLLDHRNLYTGNRMADEPAIALWEISNESCFIETILDGSSQALKGFFGTQTRRQWNEFLRMHYGSSQALRKSWGSLLENESLENGTITLAPIPVPKTDKPYSEDAAYPSRRIRDLITFFVNRYIDSNNQVLRIIRQCASQPNAGSAVVPVAFDTHYLPSLLNLYCASAGNLTIAGTYKWYRTFDTSDPTYPFSSALASEGWSGMDFGRVEGKPTVTYEINVQKPAPYRAEFPLLVASYTSSQDWDGVFWYFWMSSDSKPVKNYDDVKNGYLHYSSLADEWDGVNISCDELLLASMRLGGLMFRQGLVRPAPYPVRLSLSEDDLIWSFNSMSAWSRLASSANYRRGSRVKFLPQGAKSTEPPCPPPGMEAGDHARLGPDVTIDHTRRQMISDSANVKMFVGWPVNNVVGFNGGIRLRGIEPGKFIAFALVSDDGQPIARSNKLVMALLGTGENKGFIYDPKASKSTGFTGMLEGIVDQGDGPVLIDWPKATIELGNHRTGTCTWYNALPGVIESQKFSGNIEFDGRRPAAWAELALDPMEKEEGN